MPRGGGSTAPVKHIDFPDSVSAAADYLARLKLATDTLYRVQFGLDASDRPQLLMGPGGVTAPDLRLVRTAAKTWTYDDGAGGAVTLKNNASALQDASMRAVANGLATLDAATRLAQLVGPAAAAIVSRSTSQTITTSVVTPISMTAADTRDDASYHDPSTPTGSPPVDSRIVAPYTGLYLVRAQISYAASAAGTQRQVRLHDSGAVLLQQQQVGVYTTGNLLVSLLALVTITAADYVYLAAFHDVGSNLNINNAELRIVFLGT